MVLSWCYVDNLGSIRLNRLDSSLISARSVSVSLLIHELLFLGRWSFRPSGVVSALLSAFELCVWLLLGSSERLAKPGATRLFFFVVDSSSFDGFSQGEGVETDLRRFPRLHLIDIYKTCHGVLSAAAVSDSLVSCFLPKSLC
jgi:hypothetical protein